MRIARNVRSLPPALGIVASGLARGGTVFARRSEVLLDFFGVPCRFAASPPDILMQETSRRQLVTASAGTRMN